MMDDAAARVHRPKIVFVDSHNRIKQLDVKEQAGPDATWRS
jgi:aspartate 1-decarboxylase